LPRCLIVAGTRPEIIKVAPLLLAARTPGTPPVEMRFCLTGQHTTMAQEALSIFGVEPDADLAIMRPNQTLDDICRSVFEKLPAVLDRLAPDVVLVQGDTTTAAMSALCAFNHRIPVGHIEAGLRSHDLAAPFPEECNRKVVNAFARYNFAPTAGARDNLLREGVPPATITVTGNTVVDALRFIRERHPLDDPSAVHPAVRKPYVLITAHRRESFGGGFANICAAVRTLAERRPDVRFVYPVHLNPNVQQPVRALLGGLPNVLLIPPVPYLPLLTLLRHCEVVLTDSGGIQEEAPSFGRYCVVMREVTERMESVTEGKSELVGTDAARIVGAVIRELGEGRTRLDEANPYGDGRASERILAVLARPAHT